MEHRRQRKHLTLEVDGTQQSIDDLGGLAGAGLDVFWNEPHTDSRFMALDNVVLQPHHASGTIETRRAMGQLVRDNLAAHFAGRRLLTPVV